MFITNSILLFFNYVNKFIKFIDNFQKYFIIAWYRKIKFICLKKKTKYVNIFFMEQNLVTKFEELLALAKNGNAEAMLKVARAYEGGLGIDKDVKTAFWWFLQSANAGNAQAQYEVALWYSDGVHCEVDYQKSVYWCKRSAMQGNDEAKDFLEFLQGFDI